MLLTTLAIIAEYSYVSEQLGVRIFGRRERPTSQTEQQSDFDDIRREERRYRNRQQ